MVNGHTVTGPDFRHPYPAILFEVSRNDDVLIRDVARGVEPLGRGHSEDHIRCRDVPTVSPDDGGWGIMPVSFGRMRLHPRGEGGNLFRRERWIVGEMPTAWVCKPG